MIEDQNEEEEGRSGEGVKEGERKRGQQRTKKENRR